MNNNQSIELELANVLKALETTKTIISKFLQKYGYVTGSKVLNSEWQYFKVHPNYLIEFNTGKYVYSEADGFYQWSEDLGNVPVWAIFSYKELGL